MNKEEDILYNKTQEFGRTQFVRELARLEEENRQLKEEIQELKADYGNKSQVERDLLQIRIDKAIAFLENQNNYNMGGEMYFEDIMEIVIPILKR